MQENHESNNALERLERRGNLEAEAELAVRSLAGLFGMERDAHRAWERFSATVDSKDPRSAVAVEDVPEPASADDEDSLALMMCNLGRWYADAALDAEETSDPDSDALRAYAEYWNIAAINVGSVEAIHVLGRMYYLSVKESDRKRAAMLLEYGVSVNDGEYSAECASKLYSMLEHGWISTSWGVYVDAVNTLKQVTDYDVSEYEGAQDPGAMGDPDKLDAYLDNPPAYPMEVEGGANVRASRRNLKTILMSMGVEVDSYNGNYASIKMRGNEEIAQKLIDDGYKVRESRSSYHVYEKKEKVKRKKEE